MTEMAWLWALGMGAFAAWLGYRMGWRDAHRACAALLFHCGVRRVSSDDHSITFADGTTHTHREAP